MTVACPKQCQLVNDIASGSTEATACSGAELVLYNSYLSTPPDGTFSALLASTDCSMIFTFYLSGDRQITRSFTPGPTGQLAVVLTVPDVRRITVLCTNGTAQSTCQIFDWQFTLHYCRGLQLL